jgi:protein O-GlcNAc transferase
MMSAGSDSAEALEQRGVAALREGRNAQALELLLLARQREPKNARILGNLGVAQKRNGLLDDAIASYRLALTMEPSAALLLNLGRAEREAGRLAEASFSFERALSLAPHSCQAWSLLSNVQREAGRLEEATISARQGLMRDPWFAEAHLNEGVALHQLGELALAAVSYAVALTLDPRLDAARSNLGVALAQLAKMASGEPPEVGRVRRVLQAPDDSVAWLGLARSQAAQRRAPPAIVCYQRCNELAPRAATFHEAAILLWDAGLYGRAQELLQQGFERDDVAPRAYADFAGWLLRQSAFSLAGPRWKAILERCPDDAVALINLGVALQRQGLPSQAEILERRAVALVPDRVEPHVNLGMALSDQGQFEEATRVYRRAQELAPAQSRIASNLLFGMHFDPTQSAEAIFAEHIAFGTRFGAAAECRRVWPRDRDPRRRLRVGYVSPDMRWHPVSYFLEPVLGAHDASQFEIFCYSAVERPDAVTVRLCGLVPHFVPCAEWTDDRLVEQIERDAIDILVDLAGHTGNNRLLVFARKPSPIQVSWLGYFDTTGLDSIDYRIADAASVPESAARLFVERVVHLPRSSNCFLPPVAPEPAPVPSASSGRITFGYLNNPAKLTREVVATFARVLRGVPESRLILKYGAFSDPGLRAVSGLVRARRRPSGAPRAAGPLALAAVSRQLRAGRYRARSIPVQRRDHGVAYVVDGGPAGRARGRDAGATPGQPSVACGGAERVGGSFAGRIRADRRVAGARRYGFGQVARQPARASACFTPARWSGRHARFGGRVSNDVAGLVR